MFFAIHCNTQNVNRRNLCHSEVFCHCLLAKRNSQHFHNILPDVREQLIEYICGTSHSPLILNGKSGTGKTFLLSSIANDVSHRYFGAKIILVQKSMKKTSTSGSSSNSKCRKCNFCYQVCRKDTFQFICPPSS